MAESGKSPFGRVSRESMSEAQWRERARWIDSYCAGWTQGPFSGWERRWLAAEHWEREHGLRDAYALRDALESGAFL